jgi:hypothetical protein
MSGCAKSADRAATDSATAPANAVPPNAPAAISFADVAGKWKGRAMPENGRDTTPVLYVLTATSDTAGWTITYPNRAPIALHVTTSGDSITMSGGPYQSLRRQGVQVTIHGVVRRQSDRLVGTMLAHYAVSGTDSLVQFRTEATRAP